MTRSSRSSPAVELPRRPLIRYHGGKWRLAPWVISHMPRHLIYTEAFGGGASVLLRKPRSYSEVYNDLDGELVNLLTVMRDRGPDLVRLLKRTPYSRSDYRLSFQKTADPLELARRTVVRSFMGFGNNSINRNVVSGFRANAHRSHTTPSHDWANLPRNMVLIARRLRGVIIDNRDAIEVIEQQDRADTLHYVDPPYVWATRSSRGKGKGYAHEMSDEDHQALAARLNSVEGMVILSGYPSPLYELCYADWHRVEREALGDGACKRTEVLWINPQAWAALRRGHKQLDLYAGGAT